MKRKTICSDEMGNCLKGFETDDVSLIQNEGSNDPSTTARRRSSAALVSGAGAATADVAQANTSGDGGHHNPAHDGDAGNDRSTGRRRSSPTTATVPGSAVRSSRPHRHHRSTHNAPSTPQSSQSLRFFESTQQQSNILMNNSGRAAVVASLTEDEQVKLAKRLTIIQHLPLGRWDSTRSVNNDEECVICMCDFADGDELRYLPCLHAYHRHCIDDWLLRYLTCPSCMEPVDSALFSSFDAMPPISSSLSVGNTSTVALAAKNASKRLQTTISPRLVGDTTAPQRPASAASSNFHSTNYNVSDANSSTFNDDAVSAVTAGDSTASSAGGDAIVPPSNKSHAAFDTDGISTEPDFSASSMFANFDRSPSGSSKAHNDGNVGFGKKQRETVGDAEEKYAAVKSDTGAEHNVPAV